MCADCSLRRRKPRGICAKAGVSFTLAVPTASACRSPAVRSMHSRRARSLASRRGITVNNVQPGPIDTDMNPADSDFAKTLVPITALQRYGNTDEIASFVAYLASPEASYITGASLLADGGFAA